VVGVWRRLVRGVDRDVHAFLRQMRVQFGAGRTRPGLYTTRVEANGGRRRLHLRVHDDGSSVLFVDVADAIELTASATEVARMLLDGIPAKRVLSLLRNWHPEAVEHELEGDVGAIARVIDRLKQLTGDCPTCLPDLRRTDLFAASPRAPYKADVALTYACNNNCAHCYNEPGRKQMPSLDLRGWKRVLQHLADAGVPHIIFTGGEPTLCDHLPVLIGHAERLGQVTGVNTNGRRLADAGYMARLARAGLDHVQITLASHLAELHNEAVRAEAFEQTVAGIRNAVELLPHAITNTTLTRRNRDHATDIVEFVGDLGLTTFAMNGMICSGGGKRNPDTLTERELLPVLDAVSERACERGMRFLWYTPTEYCRLSPLELGLGAKSCNAAEYSVCIEPNGDVLPCQSYYEPVGNLLCDEWSDIWNCSLFRRIRMRRKNPRGAGLPERCYDCADLQVCGGGCPLERSGRGEAPRVSKRKTSGEGCLP
jgi:radical SAM protein with 4Fe4S-binding SPASM domain